jgi:hypothetical protein
MENSSLLNLMTIPGRICVEAIIASSTPNLERLVERD